MRTKDIKPVVLIVEKLDVGSKQDVHLALSQNESQELDDSKLNFNMEAGGALEDEEGLKNEEDHAIRKMFLDQKIRTNLIENESGQTALGSSSILNNEKIPVL